MRDWTIELMLFPLRIVGWPMVLEECIVGIDLAMRRPAAPSGECANNRLARSLPAKILVGLKSWGFGALRRGFGICRPLLQWL